MFPKFINLSSSDFDDFILENSLEIFDDRFLIVEIFIFQKSGLKPPTSVGKDPTVRRRRSIPLNPSTLVGGGSVIFLRSSQ